MEHVNLLNRISKPSAHTPIGRLLPANLDPIKFGIVDYSQLLDDLGLEMAWKVILDNISNLTIAELKGSFFDFDNLGEIYEIGLAYTNKITKKELGKYYTPDDVSSLMFELLLENTNLINLVDVGCGTGNLIISVIKTAMKSGQTDIIRRIREGRVWLYDVDPVALSICVVKIEILLQEKVGSLIHVVLGDFLDKKIELPSDCTVITNPPYSIIKEIKKNWIRSDVLLQSKDLYAGFIDRILQQERCKEVFQRESTCVDQPHL
ncbi:MAG: N-6 DNA methylase [Candidatus Izemoplasmatales bacterium]|nr:N-6 DNA methylase [Candidatus Izemoplasmatales bacterium]